jgi:MFS family permease
VYSIVMSVGFMLAFPLVGSLVQEWGWRGAWLAVGCSLLSLLAPLSAVLVRCGPESRGLLPDGDAVATAVHTAVTAVEDRQLHDDVSRARRHHRAGRRPGAVHERSDS